MATYVLIHGAADVASNWDLVAAELREHGHDVVAVDLPCEDDSAGWQDYADTVVAAVGDRTDIVVVAHSLGGFTGTLVCAQVPAELLVLVAGMIPSPGETANDWWANTGYEEAPRGHKEDHDGSDIAVFMHDVPPELAADALAKGRDQSETPHAAAVAARRLAGRADEVPAVPRGPLLPSRVDPPARAGAPEHRPRRDRRRPLPLPQPADGAGRPPGGLCRFRPRSVDA